jgi:hypothetical protein
MTKEIAIKLACSEYDYEWPEKLWTGVMFFSGYTITVQEFNKWAENFND